jgi:hypothetical protein
MNGIVGTVPDDVPIEIYLEQHDDNDTLIPIAQHPRLRARGFAAATKNRWLTRSRAGTGRIGMPGRRLRQERSSTSGSGCAMRSGFPSPRYTRRRIGTPAARWVPPVVARPTPPTSPKVPRRVVEDGSVDELLAAGKRFAEFWRQ